MRAVGIIAEYNPFHNGHAWHIEQARNLSGSRGVIAVMSGHFLQRGEPASFDKWHRAKMAILGGADLVIELPTVFAVRSAQYFAAGGVRLLSSLGIVTHLCFGAEHNDLQKLKQAADCRLEMTSDAFRKNMKYGHTYAKALTHSVGQITGISHEVLSSPNNILAIEYINAINQYAPGIIPLPVKRKFALYHDDKIEGAIASATAIRKALEQEHSVTELIRSSIPNTTAEVIEFLLSSGYGPVRYECFATALLYALRTLSSLELEYYAEISEGLHNKITECALQAGSIEELLTLLKSKRYTRTRLQRILCHILLGTKKADITEWTQAGPQYARILAFNDCGRELLKEISGSSSIVLINKTSSMLDAKAFKKIRNSTSIQKMLAVDIKASDIYSLGIPNQKFRHGGWDLLQSPLYIPFRKSICEAQG